MDLITPSLGLIFWQSIIFLLTFIILRKFAWNPINNFLEKREKNIINSINEAEKAKEKIKNFKTKKKKIIIKAEKKKKKILNEYQKEKKKIEEEAKKKVFLESQLIIEKTNLIIENKKRIALEKLKNEILNLSIIISKKILTKEFQLNNKNNNKFLKKILS
ncbi:F0F1 ATP synthase subunit B [Candidatus Karelsulcia muelleri]|uniref:F0F1 ATP synthase subunit B n=1 Tax=Candidatus Karelsulcia muelleri TaxID=336810 RepID=UPI000D7BBD68|nr:F0F1 ATP synthase subunit B [Candidatus Karelsulcia muelleri]